MLKLDECYVKLINQADYLILQNLDNNINSSIFKNLVINNNNNFLILLNEEKSYKFNLNYKSLIIFSFGNLIIYWSLIYIISNMTIIYTRTFNIYKNILKLNYR